MRVVILPSENDASNFAAEFISDFINNKKSSTLGLATGSSVLLTYEALIKKYELGQLSLKNIKTFNLDEYLGLKPGHNQSYRHYMNEKLFNHIDIDQKNTFIPEGVLLLSCCILLVSLFVFSLFCICIMVVFMCILICIPI